MKVAIVHELLTMRGGAERVARDLASLYPEAPVYTLLYNERRLGDWFPAERVRTSFIQKLAAVTRSFNHHLYLPFFRRAVEAWDLSAFDLVISSSSAFAHGIRIPPNCRHVCYVHTPARYLWDQTHAVQARIAAPLRPSAARLFHRLRMWDATAAQRPATLIAASSVVQRRIQLYWGRESTVIHPFVEDGWFAVPPKRTPTPTGGCLVVANLRTYKRIDRAIDACRTANVHLTIVGDGPARRSLEAHAKGADVRFAGRVEGEELRGLMRGARALLIPGVEDFGINAIEALACGTPVITVKGGGTEDIVEHGHTGLIVEETVEALAEAIRSPSLAVSPEDCRRRAEEFTKQEFERKMREMIGE